MRYLIKKLRVLQSVFIIFLVGLLSSESHAKGQQPEYTLDKVVIVMRHGVRPQTDIEKLEKSTGQSWPKWNVPDGYLTGHGYAGVLQQANYQFAQWKKRGLVINSPCPKVGDVFIWSSPLQRTRATAQAVTDGMFAGCGVAVNSVTKEDPLFQTIDMELSKPDSKTVEQQILSQMGGSYQKAAIKYQADIARLKDTVCNTRMDSCQFLDKPWGIKNSKPGKFKLAGPISKASAIAETIRLQYSEGLPLSKVAFGKVKDANDVAQLMALHAAKYDLVNNTDELARHGGSLLMSQVLDALSTDTKFANPQSYEKLKAPLVVFVGHDTNISQLQTILGFNWQLGIYPRNDIPPAGVLSFERYVDKQTGKYFVRISFIARSLDQWRNLTLLSVQNPPLSRDYKGVNCLQTQLGNFCPMADFIQVTRSKLVVTPLPNGLKLFQ